MTQSRPGPQQRRTPTSRDPAVQPPRGYRIRLTLARAALWWERLWPALWPACATLGLFTSLVLLDLLPLLPGWLHLCTLVAFAAAVPVSLWTMLRRLVRPTSVEARRRLERDSGLAHRPLAALEDSLATDPQDGEAALLWREHRRRLLEQTRRLRLAAPAAGWARVDRLGLRAALGLILILGVTIGGGDWQGRLADALTPRLQAVAAVVPASLDVWMNPPSYTGLPPRLLEAGDAPATAVDLPQGSVLLAQVQGGEGVPRLRLGDTTTEFESIAEGVYRISRQLDDNGLLSIEQGEAALASWDIRTIADEVPVVEYLQPPGQAARGALMIEFLASDDYGLSGARALIRRLDDPQAPPLELALGLPGSNLREAQSSSFHDLTPHPWAGIPVSITVEVRDAIDQTGQTEAFETVLPERIFNHPVARALVELRKRLTLDPEARREVARELARLGSRPAHFFGDLVVALALGSAERRLVYDDRDAAIGEVQQLLWDTALRIEEGELALAERDLREIQRQIQEALSRDASEEEIEQLLNQLQNAMDRFLDAMAEQMAEQMQQQGEEGMPQIPPGAERFAQQDLQALIEQARELARSGAKEQARQLLAQLQQLLENLRAAPFDQEMSEAMQQAQEMMRGLESVMREQQELLDRSFQRSQQGQDAQREGRPRPGEGQQRDGRGRQGQPRTGEGPPQAGEQGRQAGQPGGEGDARAQEALRRRLGEIMRQFGEMTGDIPRPLGNAERFMRDARDALQQDAPGRALQPQADALDQLQQGMEAMLESLSQQMGQGQGAQGMQSGREPGPGSDPFGRRADGPEGGLAEDTLIGTPDRSLLHRSREILNELRRRSGERRRPPLELDYIDRLLQQF